MADFSGERLLSSGATFERVRPHLADFGITRIARHTGLDNVGIPVWCAYMPNARSIVVAQGKGLTDDDARTSATMEALERAVACDPAIRATVASIDALERAGQRYHSLPQLIARGQELLSRDEMVEWVMSVDLLNGESVFVPYDAITLDRTRRNNRYWQSSDGLASGNTTGEAIFHGLMERIERDAHTLWRLSSLERQKATCIDLGCFNAGEVSRLHGQLTAAGLDVRLFDMTNDIGIPSFTALVGPADELERKSARHVEITYGSGSHFAPARAAVRALTEAAQSRLTYISGARDDLSPDIFEQPLSPRIRGLFEAIPRPFVPALPDENTDIAEILNRLRSAGIEDALAVALSDPHLPFVVVKILVPGLENPDGARRQRLGPRAVVKALFG